MPLILSELIFERKKSNAIEYGRAKSGFILFLMGSFPEKMSFLKTYRYVEIFL